MRLPLILIAASAAIATPIVAQQMTKPGSVNPALVAGGTYQADPNHTFVIWTLDHFGFSPLSGMFGQITGTLTLDPKAPNAAKVDVTIPVSKAVTTSGLTDHFLRPGKDGGKPDFFGPSPADAKFVSTKVVASGTKAKITGDLTLNGMTKPVTLDASFYGAGTAPAMAGGKQNVGFKATATIKRSEFGLGFGVPLVGDEVTLAIAAAFVKV